MAKIICPNAKIERMTTVFTELKCDASCRICKGKCFTDEDVIETSLIKEFITDAQKDIYDNGNMVYVADLEQYVEDMMK